MSIALVGGRVVRSVTGDVDDADLYVTGDRVAEPVSEAERVDVSGCLVVPGSVCAHHHLYSALARGMPGPQRSPTSFLEILESIWWRLDRALDERTIRLSALLGAVEAARCGTTTVVDHHASPQAIDGSLDLVADALEEVGVRSVVCYEVTDRHGTEDGRRGVQENLRFLASNRRPHVRAMMGAHASFTIGDDTMAYMVDAARDVGAPLHIHVAEDAADEKHSLDEHGKRTARRLAGVGALAEGDLIAHGVWLDDDEIGVLRDSGAWLAHNPRSNMNNNVGHAPVLKVTERVALGTDGLDGDMLAELKTSYLRARERSHDVGPERATVWLAGGARFAGQVFEEPALGTLTLGAPADLAVLEYHSPTPLDSSNLASHLVFGLGTWAVRDVMVAGRWIVRERRHQLVDEQELAANCRAAAPELWTRMAEL